MTRHKRGIEHGLNGYPGTASLINLIAGSMRIRRGEIVEFGKSMRLTLTVFGKADERSLTRWCIAFAEPDSLRPFVHRVDRKSL